ncbi:hypothetical protein ABPG72_019940 [Tetrahymena utriculariae]
MEEEAKEYKFSDNQLHLNQSQNEKPKVVIPKNYWSYENDKQPERLSASRNQTYYGGISEEEEEKRNQKNTRYMTNNQDKDYYDENSINYYKNEYNQNKNTNNFDSNVKNFKEMQQQYATTQQQKNKDIKDKDINENIQKENNNNEQENHKTEKQQKNQQMETDQGNRRNNNRERRKYSPSNRQYNNGQYRTRSYSSNSNTSRNSYNSNNRNRSNSRPRRNNNYNYNYNNRKQIYQYNQNRNNNKYRNQQRNQNRQDTQQKQQQKSITYIEQQKINHALSETCRYWLNSTCRNPECEREMTIKEIREYIEKQSNKLDEQEINNIEINIAVKDGRKIQQEIHNIINTSLIEIEKEKEIINQTQASLITTEEILKQLSSEEFINIRQAFTEKNKEQEYQNERSREYHLKQIEKLKQIKEKQNKEMEVEENLIRVSQNMPIYKPQIQQNQFINFQQIDNIEITNSRIKPLVENISEEDKVNKPQTSSEERQIIESPKLKKQTIPWTNMLVDTSVAILKDKQEIIIDSFKTLNKDVKEIPTGIYLILIIEAQYINDAKKIARERDKEEGFEINLQAYTEAIATYALGTLPFTVETDKIKLSASRQHMSSALNGIIKQKLDVTQPEIHQVRTQTTQGTNLNIIIHLSTNFIQDKNRLIDMTKIEK